MAAISQTINNVLGGVSQQPDPVKLPGQVREAVNAYLDPTFGCTKRPGTQFIGLLADDVPEEANWFPIFRDGQERYVACIYLDSGTPRIRVWNADTAAEATVSVVGGADQYLSVADVSSFNTLTINDYTLIINGEKDVTINTATATPSTYKALIVINSVAYNTSYTIDFLRDGQQLNQVQVYRATKLSVSPGSWEVTGTNNGGDCEFAFSENFIENGAGTNLGFNITTTCNPTLVTTEVDGDPYPTKVERIGWQGTGAPDPSIADYGMQAYCTDAFGPASDYQIGSYLYKYVDHTFPGVGEITLRVEYRVVESQYAGEDISAYELSKIDIADYTIDRADSAEWVAGLEWTDIVTLAQDLDPGYDGARPPWPAGSTAGQTFRVTNTRKGDKEYEYSYKSVYRTTVTLNNGGVDWSVGDKVTVNMEGKDYEVKVEEVAFGYSYQAEATATYATPADTQGGQLDVSAIVSELVTAINAIPEYTAVPVGNVIVIDRPDGRDFNLQTKGGTADSALYGVKDTVNDISRLPAQCEDGFTLKVSNSEESDADDYFVKFETSGGIPGQGSWIETAKPGVTTDLNPSTMPHVLERDSAGDFQLRPLTKQYNADNFWAPRDAGDEKTNPNPTFVGKKIRDAVFYMNRLGFLADESIVLSQAGDYFNFFQGSAIAVSDADPIDMGVSTTKPAKLKAAVGTPTGLLLFAENSQFLLKSQDVAFAPSTVKMDEITNYAYRSDVHPVETGVSILFPTSAETFSKVFELSVDSLNSRPLITENTRIIPEYIPPQLTWCHAVPNSSLVLMGTGDKSIYTFKFYNTGNERNLAGWAKWEFNADVKMAHFDHDTGFFVQRQADGDTTLSRMELLDDPETSPISAFGSKFTPRLDNYLYESATTTSDIDAFNLRVNLPVGFYAGTGDVYVIATDNGVETFYTQTDLQNDAAGDFIVVPSSLKGTEFIVGISYLFSVTLPAFFVKEGDANRADRRYPPMVENMYLDLYLSGRYSVDIEKLGYRTQTVDLDVIKADIYLANDAAMAGFDTREIPVFSRGDLATVTIKSPDPLPAALTSYSWEGHYSTRGIARR